MPPRVLKLPVLVVTPHSSGHAPHDVLSLMLGPRALDRQARESRLAYLFSHGEPYTDMIFHSARARVWHAGVSPFVVDLAQDREEEMNDIIKTVDVWSRPLYPWGFELTPHEREERLRRYWDPFHDEIERSIVRHDIRLLVTGHSMHPVGPPGTRDEGRRRPAMILLTGGGGVGEPVGTSRVTVDAGRARALHHLLELHFGDIVSATRDVPHVIALNHPWSRDPLSFRFSHELRPRQVPGFGLEVNRSLYMNRAGEHDVPDDARLHALNLAFERFLRDAVLLFDEEVA